MKLDVTDAAELAEMLQSLSQWLAQDPGRLAASLEQFVGHLAYGLAQLRGDLERFVFLLGDGEPCSAHDRAFPRASRGYAGPYGALQVF